MNGRQPAPNPETDHDAGHAEKATRAARLVPPAGVRHAKRVELAARLAGQRQPSAPELPAPSAGASLVRDRTARVIGRLGQAYLSDADREPEAGS